MWNNHIEKIVNKAKRSLHFVMRNIQGSAQATKVHAYKCLVRPLLEYCSGVWDPYTATMIEKIESVQRRAARHATNNHKRWSTTTQRPQVSVTALLENLKWESLASRRRRVSLRCLYKAMTGAPAWNDLLKLTSKAERHSRNDHNNKLILKRYNTNSGLQSFLGRTTRLWNNLPPSTMNTLPGKSTFEKTIALAHR